MGSIISVELKLSEVRAVSDEFRFETFVDAHSNIFHEYLSSVIANANSHFLRPAGPHFPASQGHIKRSALEIGRARGAPPC